MVSPVPARPEAPPDPAVRTPQARLARLFDPGTAVPLHPPDTTEVGTAHGRIEGAPVVAYCTDATRKGGALGLDGSQRIIEAIETAVRERRPVIGLWHSGGANLADGVASMHGVGRMFAAMTAASGRVPQISVVLGPAAGAAAYGPALTDIVIMAPDARMFVTGPDVVRMVTGEQIDMAGLGGTDAHGRHSGVVHVTADSEADAYRRARDLAGLLTRRGYFDPRAVPEGDDPRALLPASPRRAYDVRPLVRALLDQTDGAGFHEFQARWAPNIVVGLGRLAGRTIGVVANNPLRKGGCLDSLSAEKAARFVRMCNSFGLPLLVVVDVPGYLPGVSQEWGGVIRRGAKLLHAFAEATVPRVTLITRKAYGGAYIAMNSRALGATAVYAWPAAEISVMGPEAAARVVHRKALATVAGDERPALENRLVAELRSVSDVTNAVCLGVVDEVIVPRQSRRKLAEAFATAPAGPGGNTNIPL